VPKADSLGAGRSLDLSIFGCGAHTKRDAFDTAAASISFDA